MAKILVGEVAHFFGKINVAALKLNSGLNEGDRISVEHRNGTVVLEQIVDSMEVQHKQVQSAKAGDDVAIKTTGKVHTGNLVYKMSE